MNNHTVRARTPETTLAAKITPGPWKWVEHTYESWDNPGDEHGYKSLKAADGTTVIGYFGCGSHEIDVPNKVDAALIENAPELLNTCKTLLAAYEALLIIAPGSSTTPLVGIAKAVIAKATGQAKE